MPIDIISSTSNPRVKQLLALQQKSAERRRRGMFVVEGVRELSHCLSAKMEVETVFHCPTLTEGNLEVLQLLSILPPTRIIQVTEGLYSKIAYRGGTEGLVAEVKTRPLTLGDLHLGDNPLLMVLEGVEKPGNLGAVLRSADAAAADAVIICDPLTDIYNPNIIRSSIGAVFTVPCVACTTLDCISFLKEKGIRILTAQLQDSFLYYDTDMTHGTAIVMGTEATGLTNSWRDAADAHIRIPMLGNLDSLNVSVSAAILLFEAVRQRQRTS